MKTKDLKKEFIQAKTEYESQYFTKFRVDLVKEKFEKLFKNLSYTFDEFYFNSEDNTYIRTFNCCKVKYGNLEFNPLSVTIQFEISKIVELNIILSFKYGIEIIDENFIHDIYFNYQNNTLFIL